MADIFSYPATLTLIVLNVFASLIAFQNDRFNTQNILWVGPMKDRGEWHRLISSGFLHVAFWHLAVNMVTLYSIGPYVEAALDGTRFLLVYLAGLIGGNIWAYLQNKNDLEYRSLGASGAVSAIVLVFCLMYPFESLSLFFVVPIWGIILGPAFIILSFILSKRADRVIGHEAHLGGALSGIVTGLLVAPPLWAHFLAQIAEKFG